MKKLIKILVAVAVIIVALGLGKNVLIKSVVTSGAGFVTGAPVKIDSLAVGVFRPRVEIKGFKMYNPPNFPKQVMVDIPHILVVYDLPALLKGKLHLPETAFDLNKLVLVKDKEGKLNVDSLQVAQQKEEAPAKKEAKKPSKQMTMQLDLVKLNLGQVVLEDHTQGEPPNVRAWDIGVKDKTYKNITSAQQLVALILTQAMGPTALKSGAMYAAATVLGVGFLPAGVAGVLLSKDSSTNTFNVPLTTAFEKAREALAKAGEVTKEEADRGILQGKVDGSDVTVTIVDKGQNSVAIKVKARKMMLPKEDVATGILYQISEQLKR